jgi:hypothetical protein
VNTPISNPESISRFKKERFLLSMSEDTFRDTVVRPLFLRQGLQDGRDVCGVNEKGKDAIFISVDELGIENLYAVQTKKGTLTMSRRVNDNLIEAITQLKTAIATRVPLAAKHKKIFPARVFLCCSGKINENARQHIVDEVQDARIGFMDADDLIPRIDEFFPELWLGIDAELFPYFRSVKKMVEAASDNALILDVVPGGAALDAATDTMFVPLRLHRIWFKSEFKGGKINQTTVFDELPVTGVINRKERLILIVGEAGAGKSTSMKRIAYVLAEKGLSTEAKCKIPVLIRATEVWTNQLRPLVDICVEATMRLMNSNKPSFSNDDLKDGRVVILIDALDELGSDESRKGILISAHSFHKEYPKCQIILTSRAYSFLDGSPELKDFTRFDLTPINYKQAQQIIRRFERKRGLPCESSNEILRRLQQVHGMELNPLLVTVFAATTDYARKDIPANITELFKKFTEWMLGRWDSAKGLGQQYHAPLKDFLLKNLAFDLHRRRVTGLGILDFKDIIRVELEHRGRQADFEQLFDEILNRSGLLRIVDGRVEFRHHLLQEFFAGRGIPSNEHLEAIIHDQWWQRPIVFYFGEHPDEGSAFSKITATLSARTKPEVFSAALTVGLALQACYLLKTREKQEVLSWVIETLAESKAGFLKETDPHGKFPLSRFTMYYLTGRDAVACDTLALESESILSALKKEGLTQDEQDLRQFWIIVGLLECGELTKAEGMIAQFHPRDMRLMVAIHLGCILIAHLKITTKQEKKIAQQILSSIGHQIAFLREEIIAEWKTELLELRKGHLKAIEMPNQTESETGAGDSR